VLFCRKITAACSGYPQVSRKEAFREDLKLRLKYPLCPAANGTSAASLITFVQDRPRLDRRYAIDSNKITTELGFQPCISLKNGLRTTFNRYVQND
jgi:dTDP-glucose 4,6-dehydratase